MELLYLVSQVAVLQNKHKPLLFHALCSKSRQQGFRTGSYLGDKSNKRAIKVMFRVRGRFQHIVRVFNLQTLPLALNFHMLV